MAANVKDRINALRAKGREALERARLQFKSRWHGLQATIKARMADFKARAAAQAAEAASAPPREPFHKALIKVRSLKDLKDLYRSRVEPGAQKLLSTGLTRMEGLPPLREIAKKLNRKPVLWGLLFIAGMLTADLGMQLLGVTLLAPGKERVRQRGPKVIVERPFLKAKGLYENIITINAFCPGCPVPDLKLRLVERPKDCMKAKPLASSNVKLIGTIVLSDPQYSVATVTDGSPESTAIMRGDNYKSTGKVFEIRRNRVCFENQDGTLAFIEIPDEGIKFGQPLETAFPTSNAEGIAKTSDNEVEIKRSFLLEKLNDPNILFQAYAVPIREDGVIKGFEIKSIVPGSVYESLGMQVGDKLRSVDGQPLNSIAQAQALYAALRSANEINIEIERGGQSQNHKFKVK